MPNLEELAMINQNSGEIRKASDDGLFESEPFRFAKFMLNDEDIRAILPATKEGGIHLSEVFWPAFDKEFALTNFTDLDIPWLENWFEIWKIGYMMSRPEEELTFDEIRQFEQLKVKFIAKVKRSTGGMMRERGLFAQQHQSRTFMSNEQAQPSGGILGKIGGFFGGGKK